MAYRPALPGQRVHSQARHPQYVGAEQVEERLRNGYSFDFDPQEDVLQYDTERVQAPLSMGRPPKPVAMQPRTVVGDPTLRSSKYATRRGGAKIGLASSSESSGAATGSGHASARGAGPHTGRSYHSGSSRVPPEVVPPRTSVLSRVLNVHQGRATQLLEAARAESRPMVMEQREIEEEEAMREMVRLQATLLEEQAGAMDEEAVLLRTGEDAVSFFSRFGRKSPIKFVYLNREFGLESLEFRPYNLVVVRREDSNPEHYTMSAEGVVHITPGQPAEFTSLAQWMRESTLFNVLTRIRFFKNFLIGKAFREWRSNIRFNRFSRTRRRLTRRLFLAKPAFVDALVDLQQTSGSHIHSKPVMDLTPERDPLTVEAFSSKQNEQRASAQKRFEDTIAEIDDLLIKLCESVVQRAHAPDAANSENWEQLASGTLGSPERKSRRVKSMTEQQQEEKEKARALRLAQEEAAMLKDFVRLADFVVSEHLVSSTCHVSELFLQLISDREEHPLMFKTTVEFNRESGILFSPVLERIQATVHRLLEETIAMVNSVSRILSNQHLTEFFREDRRASSGSSVHFIPVGSSVQRTPVFRNVAALSDAIVERDYHRVTNKATHDYHKFKDAHKFVTTWSLEKYKKGDLSSYELEKGFKKIKRLNDEVNGMRAIDKLGSVFVEHKPMQNELAERLSRIYGDMLDVLKSTYINNCKEAVSVLEDRIQLLEQRPDILEGFANFVRNLNSIRAEYGDINHLVDEVVAMNALVESHNVPVDMDDQVTFQNLKSLGDSFLVHFSESERWSDEHRNENSRKLEMEIRETDEAVLKLMMSLRGGIFKDINSEPDQVLDVLEKVEEELGYQKERTDVLSDYLRLFGIRPKEWENLDGAFEQFRYQKELWETLANFRQQVDDWDATEVAHLNGTELTDMTQQFYVTAFRLAKKGGSHDEVADMLKSEVKEWQEKVPVLSSVAGTTLKFRHWKAIFDAMDKHYFKDRGYTVGTLLTAGICEHRDVVEIEAAKAQGEQSLETKLLKIKNVWEELEFEVKHHRDQRDLLIIGGVDEVTAQLEENQIDLSAMLGHRYVGGIKAEVEEWDANLNLVSEVLDEWVTCQRNWMYLEFIFSSPDIQKQLPRESSLFQKVDAKWKDVMRKTNNNPNVLMACKQPGMLQSLQDNNHFLDEIQKSLEEYLETKRAAFPRFYFLSNDELLAILSQTREPRAVQPHLRKCFDAIAELIFAEGSLGDILGMKSGEDEEVPFSNVVQARGNVEDWLRDVESMMRLTLYNLLSDANQAYQEMSREEWFFEFPSQCVLAVDQIMWTSQVTDALNAIESGVNRKALTDYYSFYVQQLDKMVQLVRGELTKLQRATMGCLIVMDVHARDVVERMIQEGCSSETDFQWTMQLRYYWDMTVNNCVVRQTNAAFNYGFEYLGNQPRLVITPLTDRCYLTCTGALKMNLGGSPQGPAGTGKTESVKDLAKALARQCVVFNCSDSIEYTFMGRMFSGLAQTGAWACFDEFNRIDIEVLSVIAQQILTIQGAIIGGKSEFLFIDRTIPLNPNFGVFITMNPGYAGRTELPDNLKALFRPIAMMIPDYALIAEIMLFSEGFSGAKSLAQKMVNLFKLASEQLSKQDHYDFGMRAVKSILVMAGALKRREADLPEDVLLIRAMRDANVPKFLAEDVLLFMALIRDLFPGKDIPDTDTGNLQKEIEKALVDQNLQVVPTFVHKIVQLYETMAVRHGVMLVGTTGTGKTVCYRALQTALTSLAIQGADPANELYCKVHTHQLNPKSVTMADLYGELNDVTGEWRDGLIATVARETVAAARQSPDRNWIVFDGPVDALWIENMNTVLDDNKMLCLPNGERIKLPNTVTMMFEVQDLAVASPATVSRCGMVYLDECNLEDGWQPQVRSMIRECTRVKTTINEDGKKVPDESAMPPPIPGDADMENYLLERMMKVMPPLLDFVRKNCHLHIDGGNLNLVDSCIKLLVALISRATDPEMPDPSAMRDDVNTRPPGGAASSSDGADLPPDLLPGADKAADDGGITRKPSPGDTAFLPDTWESQKRLVDSYLVLSLVWSVGAALDDRSRPKFSRFAMPLLKEICPSLPSEDDGGWCSSVYDFCVRRSDLSFIPWTDIIPMFTYDPKSSYFNLLVPNVQSVRTQYLLDALIPGPIHRNVLLTGETGVGKTVIGMDFLRKTLHTDKPLSDYTSVTINFSAQTSSLYLQQTMEQKLEKKGKTLGGPGGKHMVFVIDDLNMPALEKFGAQPPIELLRQTVDQGGFYDRLKLVFKRVKDTNFLTACGPPGGGRNTTTMRLLRHFHVISLPELEDSSMKRIFESIMSGFLSSQGFPEAVRKLSSPLVESSVRLYKMIATDMLPTPSKMHYTFNLRDLSKVFQGLCQATPKYMPDVDNFVRLWCHETLRVFHDRLVNAEDRSWFVNTQVQLLSEVLNMQMDPEDFKTTMFGGFLDKEESDPVYRPIPRGDTLLEALEELQEEYNVTAGGGHLNLVFFTDAIMHLSRICRVLQQPRGNALLVGVGGSGRQSLTKLASFLSNCTFMQPEISRNYGKQEFREDVKRALLHAGAKNKPVVFCLTDSQIVQEEFLEDINCVLNTGEVPNIFGTEDHDFIREMVTPLAEKNGRGGSRDALYSYFIELVRENLHVVLAMSPIGETFRKRIRMFPALVNNCTIDWFDQWPEEALLGVATQFLESANVGDEAIKHAVCKMCVKIHSSVTQMSETFYEELRRYNYTTPTSYLELLNLYSTVLDEIGSAKDADIKKFGTGLEKLRETNEMVKDMEADLSKLQPVLEQNAKNVAELLVEIEREQKEADEVETVCKKEEEECLVIMQTCQAIKDDCQADLETALPALRRAEVAVQKLDKDSITEVKSFKQPPEVVVLVMEAVCLLFDAKQNWESGLKLLSASNFRDSLINYDKENVTDSTLRKLKRFINDPRFTEENVARVSKAALAICSWVRALDSFAYVSKAVAPKREKLREAQAELEEAQGQLEEKQSQLREIQARVAALQRKYDNSMKEKEDLTAQIGLTEKRLERASRLMQLLSGERVRWAEESERLKSTRSNVIGDALLSAGGVAYLGPFTADFRARLLHQWKTWCHREGVPVSEDHELISIADPVKVREWVQQGLPGDDFSLENGVLVTRGRRWPLMVDPQGQANNWIKHMEAEHGLKVLKLNDSKWIQTLENCISLGSPALLENVPETLEPLLDPVLTKSIIKQGARYTIRLGDKEVDYSPDFRFYMTTKLPNPHYLPEVCIKVTIINFTVTPSGLEEQLLADVVGHERPELEEQRDGLIKEISAGQDTLKELENKTLQLLAESGDDILDHDDLINTLAASKQTSGEVKVSVERASKTAEEINKTRNSYRPVALRGSVLYFVVVDLASLDPMYQTSLQFFKMLFGQVLHKTETSEDVQKRIDAVVGNLTETSYQVVCRGLFEKHKPLFAFMIAAQILRKEGDISDAEWDLFLRGSGGQLDMTNFPPVPHSYISEDVWKELCALSRIPKFSAILDDIATEEAHWMPFFLDNDPHLLPLPSGYQEEISHWEWLLLIRTLRSEKLTFAAKVFVRHILGDSFAEAPGFDLEGAFLDSNPLTPIIFVLSAGADPAMLFQTFAREQGMESRYRMRSLGQGQGTFAAKDIQIGCEKGEWICLQNCHLSVSWLPELERILEGLVGKHIHEDFRLWLTSMPTELFPVPILQSGIKLTNEPPKGLRANILRSIRDLGEGEWEDSPRPFEWRRLLFGLTFFHAVLQERRKYGPNGWNIPYEWNTSDLNASVQSLRMYLEEQDVVPWEALQYIVGTINYGGRVTDFLDLRCVKSILAKYFNPKILEDEYPFTTDGVYRAPQDLDFEDVLSYVRSLPIDETPLVFGLHDNASISFQATESKVMLDCIISMQPRASTKVKNEEEEEEEEDKEEESTSELQGPDALVNEACVEIQSMLPALLDTTRAHPDTFKRMPDGNLNSLGTVLSQEIDSFNRLLRLMSSSLEELQKAIKGLVVMSSELDAMYASFIYSKVPSRWAAAYPSVKPLYPWVKDLVQRVEFLRSWLENGPPPAFWISGFSFPQGFITGVLQTHSRKYSIPIDTLRFRTEVLTIENPKDILEGPPTGVYIYGLFMEGARWDRESGGVEESRQGELYDPIPVIWLEPEDVSKEKDSSLYLCPVYKTGTRAGTLSTTGLSTNFVLSVDLPSKRDPDHWIQRGVALLTMLEN